MKFFNIYRNKSLLRKHIFDEVSGYPEERWILEQALNNEEPTHILLVGPPGIGKTRFLKAKEKYYPVLSPERIANVAKCAGIEPKIVFKNIFVKIVYSQRHQLEVAKQVSDLSLVIKT